MKMRARSVYAENPLGREARKDQSRANGPIAAARRRDQPGTNLASGKR
jgi:hypothetical protein